MNKVKILFTALSLTIPGFTRAQIIPQETIFEGLTGNVLLDSLANTYRPASVLNYNDARDLMFSEIYNQNGINICNYTGDTIAIPFAHPSPRTIANAHIPNWNTEHIYPQSKGASSGNANSDLHHLVPVRADVNSSRGNSPFGFVKPEDATNWWNHNGGTSANPNANQAQYSKAMGSSKFEPRDAVKGDIARAVFYFFAVYNNEALNADPGFFRQQYEDLKAFHQNDPVDLLESQRNNLKAAVQDGKVNPFILDTTLVRRAFFENFVYPDSTGENSDYFIDFEDVFKSGYADDFIMIKNISWKLDNFLIGTSVNDMKIDSRSARGRHQTSPALLEMQEDLTGGIGELSFLYARSNFSNDRTPNAVQLAVEYSLNEGESWIETGSIIETDSVDDMTLYKTEINEAGNFRIRIRSIGGDDGRRFNIDNLLITKYDTPVISNTQPPSAVPEQKPELQQNYPNPVTDYTTIIYYLSSDAQVNLEIYNMMGQKVKTPVNKYATKGKHEVTINTLNLPAGVYIYTLTTPTHTFSKKMNVIH